MVYSTCTILRQENDDVVTSFLNENPNFELIPTETTYKLKLDHAKKPYMCIPMSTIQMAFSLLH
jgi:16S rRNA (cytosine967-C5)-methyltransferase